MATALVVPGNRVVELSHVFAEGRAQLGRRQARNAVEFTLALATLGVSRGFNSFVRYSFVKRNGLSYFAAPLGRVEVVPRPRARLLDDPPLSDWVQKLREACRDKDKTPARYPAALRQIDRAMYEFAHRSEHGNDQKYLIEVLRALGRAERTLANGLAFCKDKYIRPMQGLNPRWLIDAAPAYDAGREFRLAASLASITAEQKKALGPLRAHLEPVEQKGQWTNWSPGSTSAVWSNRPLIDNLASVLLRRLVESEKASVKGCSLRARVFAHLDDVVAFINGQTDDDLLSDLLWALVGVSWTATDFRRRDYRRGLSSAFRSRITTAAPMAFGLIRLTLTPLEFTTEKSPIRQEGLRWRIASERIGTGIPTTPTAEPFQQLARGSLPQAEDLAARRLWSDRIAPFGWANRRQRHSRFDSGCAIDATRLLAACLFPLSSTSLERLARQVLNPPSDAT